MNINIHLRSYICNIQIFYMKILVLFNGNFYAKTAFNISKFGDNRDIVGIRKDDYETH